MAEAADYASVLQHLAAKTEEPGHGDAFKLKVLRRPNAASQVTQYVATFTDATLSMIANAESWLAPFAGGGLYVLHVYDARGRVNHGTISPAEIPGPARAPDPRVTRAQTWTGPVLIDSPTLGVGIAQLPPLAGEPYPAAVPPRSVPEAVGFSGLFTQSRELDERYRQKEAELAERERRMQADQHRAEREADRRAAEERLRMLEAKITEASARPAGPSITDILSPIVGAITGIVPLWLAKVGKDSEERMAIERARIEREEKILAAQQGKPIIDPQILEILRASSERAEASAKQFGELMRAQAESARSSLETNGVAQRSMFQSIAQMMELQAKIGGVEGEEPKMDWGKLIAGVLQGLAAMQAGRPPGAPGAPGVTVPGTQVTTPAPNGMVAAPAGPIPESEAFDRVERMVKEKRPPSEVCDELKKALADEAAQKEIAASGGLMGVLNERLGEWSETEANQPYIEALQKELIAAKVFDPSMFE